MPKIFDYYRVLFLKLMSEAFITFWRSSGIELLLLNDDYLTEFRPLVL